VPSVVRAGNGPTGPAPWAVFSAVAGRLLCSERGVGWRAMDSLARGSARPFDDFANATLIDLKTHRVVFAWIQQRLVETNLLVGKTVGIDATTLAANAAMRSIVRRDTGDTYQEYLTRLAQASGIETPTREDLARVDKKRKKTTSNKDWMHPGDPDAKVAKMKDGRTQARPSMPLTSRPVSPSPSRR
jgi:transposase